MATTLRGRFVEAVSVGVEKTAIFSLEEVTVVEMDPEGLSHLEATTIHLVMPSVVSGDDWIGREMVVEGRFDIPPPGETRRLVFVVKRIVED